MHDSPRRRRRAAALCLASLLAAAVAVTTPARAALVEDVRADADWLLQAVSPDGGIGTWIDRAWLVPYRSNFAAMGLARATAVTGDSRYANAAWRWLDWYVAHMDSRGFVTDYQWRDGAWRSTGDMDSTDAYATTFLMAAAECLRATGDLSRLSGLRNGLWRAMGALEATETSDGLHFAKPTWPIKYVMDESENYAGLVAAASLGAALGDDALRTRALDKASRLRAAFRKFASPTGVGYDWALDGRDGHSPIVWSQMYASAIAQPWAIAFGLVEGAEAAALFARFEREQPSWDVPTATTQYPWGEGKVDYWPVAGLAAARAGDRARADRAAASIRAAALAANRFWPFTTAEAGELILLQTDGRAPVAPLRRIDTSFRNVRAVSFSASAPAPPRPTATLVESSSGRAVGGVPITFWTKSSSGARGRSICTAVTDGAGVASCSGASAALDGVSGFVVVFDGTALHAPSQAASQTA